MELLRRPPALQNVDAALRHGQIAPMNALSIEDVHPIALRDRRDAPHEQCRNSSIDGRLLGLDACSCTSGPWRRETGT